MRWPAPRSPKQSVPQRRLPVISRHSNRRPRSARSVRGAAESWPLPIYETQSERLHDRVGARHLEATRLLDAQRLDDAVVDDHGVALRAHAEAIAAAVHLEAHGLREFAVAVGQHLHLAVRLL